jgi:DNA-binding transcriptional regulator GbsR (MarR family)
VLTDKQTKLIEKMGIHFERSIPPAAARIFALLIVSDKDSYSFDEIREVLNLSKSATSNGLNFLLNMKKIEYFTRSGDRKRYFTWCPKNTLSHFKEGIEQALGLSILFDETLSLKKAKDSSHYRMLEELHDLMNFLKMEMPAVYAKWENSKPNRLKRDE